MKKSFAMLDDVDKAELHESYRAHLASNNFSAIEKMLSDGMPIDFSITRTTPLFFAVELRDATAISFLLMKGATLASNDPDVRDVFHYCDCCSNETAKKLIQSWNRLHIKKSRLATASRLSP